MGEQIDYCNTVAPFEEEYPKSYETCFNVGIWPFLSMSLSLE